MTPKSLKAREYWSMGFNMSRSRMVLLVILLVGVGVVTQYGRLMSDGPRPAIERSPAFEKNQAEKSGGVAASTGAEPSSSPANDDEPGELRVENGSMVQAREPKNPETAMSDEQLDQMWRAKHGFPSEEMLRNAKYDGLAEIRRLASNGDLAARGVLGASLASSSMTRVEGLAMLHDAAADGSIFALHELAGRLGPTVPNGSIESYFAYMQAAAALGDLGAMPFLVRTVGQMSREQYASGMVLFSQIMSSLSENSVRRNGVGLRANLRPLATPPTEKNNG